MEVDDDDGLSLSPSPAVATETDDDNPVEPMVTNQDVFGKLPLFNGLCP